MLGGVFPNHLRPRAGSLFVFAQGLSPVAYAPSGLLPPIRRGSELRPIWSAAGSGVELDHYQCQHTYK